MARVGINTLLADSEVRTKLYDNIKEKCKDPFTGYIDSNDGLHTSYDFNDTCVVINGEKGMLCDGSIVGERRAVDKTVKELGLEKYIVGAGK